MLRQDYILRMIQQLAQAVARLTAKARTEEPAAVHAELHDALKDLTGLDFDVLDSLPLAAVLQVLEADNDPNPARILAIAECSFIRARLADAADQVDIALRARVMALTLYLETFTLFRHEALAEAEKRAEDLLADLGGIDLPRDTILRLFRYRSATGRFADAENSLFDLVDRGLANSAVIGEGQKFYRRLLDLEDAQLAAGELPRDEVIEGQAELEVASVGS
ncbi:MAG: hypothetical protein DRJ65_09720 [Acidobacteria bacterium]|nr:MAG: hypothetical protein DRJ65_09720 [Acidobacteriota bacterium]